jgi:squalene-hopene/tetraprenyl-beta-curcumene cyclase
MKKTTRATVLTLSFFFLTTLPATPALAGGTPSPRWDPKAAADYLDGRADWWRGWSGSARGQGTVCLSCHTSMPFALARPALGGQMGEKTAGKAEQQLIDIVKKRVTNWDRIIAKEDAAKDRFVPFYSGGRRPSALGTESVLDALALVNHDTRRGKGVLSPLTRTALQHLWEQQQPNGAWIWLDFGLGPWEGDSTYYGAALAAVAVGTAGPSYYGQTEFQPKVAALKKYLQSQLATQPLHHRAVGLWASSRLPDLLPKSERKKLIEELFQVQEADGGWSLPKLGKRPSTTTSWQSHGVYPAGTVSDGYATGLVVLALRRAGVAASHPQLQRGIAWLTTHQKDGTWPVHYPNRARDPQNDIGKFMRDAATAFAVLALTEPSKD